MNLADPRPDVHLEYIAHLRVTELAGQRRRCAQDGDSTPLDLEGGGIASGQEGKRLGATFVDFECQHCADHDLISWPEAHGVEVLYAALQRQTSLTKGVGEVALSSDGCPLPAVAWSMLAVHPGSRPRSVFARFVGMKAIGQERPPGSDDGLFADAQGCTAAG